MTAPTTATADADLVELVRSALSREGKPLKAAEIKKALPNPYKNRATPALLDELAAAGRIYRHTKGKTVAFGLEPLDTLARRGILEAVSEEPKKWADLAKAPALKPAKAFLAAKPIESLRDALIAEGLIFEWPKSGPKGAILYATRPADARQFLEKSEAFRKARTKFLEEVEKLARGLSRAGVSTAEVKRLASELLLKEVGGSPLREEQPAPAHQAEVPYGPELSTLILERMIDEEPAAAGGAPVSIQNLRRALAFQLPGKAQFDDALRTLAREGVLALHRYDHPAGLSHVEREELVPDGQGGFYIAVSRRS